MEENQEQIPQQEQESQEQQSYTPRPAWQVWGARLGVIVMLIAFVLYCLHIAGIGI